MEVVQRMSGLGGKVLSKVFAEAREGTNSHYSHSE